MERPSLPPFRQLGRFVRSSRIQQIAQPPRRVVQSSALSVVVPAYNEARRLETSLPALVDLASDAGAELIVVDDGSDDRTADVAAEYTAKLRGAKVVRLPLNSGKGAAVRAGVAHARGRPIVFM